MLFEGVMDTYYYGYRENFCNYNNLTFTNEFHLKYNTTTNDSNIITTGVSWIDEGWLMKDLYTAMLTAYISL